MHLLSTLIHLYSIIDLYLYGCIYIYIYVYTCIYMSFRDGERIPKEDGMDSRAVQRLYCGRHSLGGGTKILKLLFYVPALDPV